MIERFDGNARMHTAVIHNGTLYLSGQTFPTGESVEAQAEGVLEKIDGLLKKYGSDRAKMLTAVVYLRDMAHFARFNAVWDAWVVPGSQPTRSCVEARMATEKHLVEIVVTAALCE